MTADDRDTGYTASRYTKMHLWTGYALLDNLLQSVCLNIP